MATMTNEKGSSLAIKGERPDDPSSKEIDYIRESIEKQQTKEEGK